MKTIMGDYVLTALFTAAALSLSVAIISNCVKKEKKPLGEVKTARRPSEHVKKAKKAPKPPSKVVEKAEPPENSPKTLEKPRDAVEPLGEKAKEPRDEKEKEKEQKKKVVVESEVKVSEDQGLGAKEKKKSKKTIEKEVPEVDNMKTAIDEEEERKKRHLERIKRILRGEEKKRGDSVYECKTLLDYVDDVSLDEWGIAEDPKKTAKTGDVVEKKVKNVSKADEEIQTPEKIVETSKPSEKAKEN